MEKTEQDLALASEIFQRDFLNGQDGFLSRDLVRRPDGSFWDIILWENQKKANAVFARAQVSQAAKLYFAVMTFDAEANDPGVEHCTIVRSFNAAGL